MNNYLKRALTAEELTKAKPGKLPGIGSSPICDFCGERTPIYVYASKVMSTGPKIRCWRWTACAVCDQDIQDHNWGAMLKRTYETTSRALGLVFQIDLIEQMKLFEAVSDVYVEFLTNAIVDERE